jgi:hypothetical protein
MPVADDGEDQDQCRDHQQAGRLQRVDLRRAVMLGCRVLGRIRIQLSFWARRRHGNIVALESAGMLPKKLIRKCSFMEPG